MKHGPCAMARSGSTGADGEKSRASADRSDLQELSLEEVLKSYEQPINEEQAWAVCFQCCSGIRPPHPLGPVIELSSILLHRDGTVTLPHEHLCVDHEGVSNSPAAERQLVQTLGVAIYRALDWGLDASEERELSPQLEQLIEGMAGGEADSGGGSGTSDEGYSDPEEEELEEEPGARPVCSLRQVMALCACRLAEPGLAAEHYQAVCRALFVETMELQTFLLKIRDAKEMLKKISAEDSVEDRSTAQLDTLQHHDWARLWVQLMKELRQGVKLKQVQETAFPPLPSEFSLTPFEMLMQDIRTRKFQLRKVMVDGDIPTRVKRNAHELILDFIRSRPPLKPVSERSLPPPPPQPQSLHEQVLAQIKQERKLRHVPPVRPFGSLPCLAQPCSCQPKSSSCMDLSVSRPRVLLKAPTLAEMEEMNSSEEEESPEGAELYRTDSIGPLKRDRSFSEQDVALLRGDAAEPLRARTLPSARPPPQHRASFPGQAWASAPAPPPAPWPLSALHESTDADLHLWMDEFSHPVESLALTVDEVINVRRVLVKAEMEKYLQSKELYNNLKKGKVCCCCRVRFPLLSWPSSCLFCKRSVCSTCSAKMKIPSKKMAHIPVYAVGFHVAPKDQVHKSQVFKCVHGLCGRAVEEEFPHLYAHGCSLRDVCSDCSKFVADVVSSSRRSLDILNTPKRDLKTAPPAKRPPPAVP
ncbi:protein spire homolog 2 [Periophthalmus magnuspinnatus]|uniref:protein spire homolog 2 n=1 Tax=Periophthalmus magnuspinnatus TaxID=409849 RepID=UPI002436DB8B|nr:protein spire homolog 2 [Periophthalmus magnuspinnatus]